ncbi:MFS transporter [Sphingobium sp. Ant17]|uniref:MFS transporter n=1 Tax=Sphingobium sp. Ant17 TaxID=1461752 RepID=UPI000448A632|nr:MFS transporter [Sphingobium sp. Ant17]EXS69964.1 MFS transporter [Sphingobium sp. Ant17]
MGQVSEHGPQGSPRWALAGLSLAMLMPSFATSTANVALPELTKLYAASFQAAQWVVLSYLLTITALIVVVGRLGDVLGRRRLMLAGVTVFAGGSMLSGVAPSLEMLISARVVQGVGAATMMALTMAFASAVVPRSRTGSAMGLLGTMSAVGTTLGPALGGLVTAWTGSRAIFMVNVPLAMVTLLIAARTLPHDPPRVAAPSTRFDLAGTALLAAALIAFALAMTLGRGQFGSLNFAALVTAFVACNAFIVVEARAPFPLVPLNLIRNRALLASLSTNMIVSAVMMATLIIGPFYLSKVIGLAAAPAGLVMAVGPLAAAMAGVPAGRLVDRLGTERVALGGLAALAAGTAYLSVIPAVFGVAGYVAPIVTMTIGYGLFQAANSTKIMTGGRPAERGLISGMLNLSRNLGLITGVSTMGAIFAWGTAANDVVTASPEMILNGMHSTFVVAFFLIIGSSLVSFHAARNISAERTG